MMSAPLRLALALLLATPATAQSVQENASYTVSVAGITAGKLTLAANSSPGAYSVKSRAESAGLAGVFSSFLVVAQASGRIRGGQLRPQVYEARSEGARAGRGAEIVYDGAIPRIVKSAEEPREGAPVIDPASMGGTIDPQTAMFALLRSVDAADHCRLDVSLYDGHRNSRLTLRPDPGNPLACLGNYRRLNGYPAADLAERRDFPFAVAYTALPDGRLQVAEVSLDSRFGIARVTRD